MQQFCVSSIRDLFAKDVEKFRTETCRLMEELLASPPDSAARVREAVCQVHALKGLTALVGAWGLSQWGANLEKLLSYSEDLLSTDPAQAKGIFQYVKASADAWWEMNELSIEEKFDEAQAIHDLLRLELAERWPDHLADKTWSAETVATSGSKIDCSQGVELVEVKTPALRGRTPAPASQASTVMFKPGTPQSPIDKSGFLPETVAPKLKKKDALKRGALETPEGLPAVVGPRLKRRDAAPGPVVATTTTVAPPPHPGANEKKDVVDDGLLELLRGELEGYLQELGAKLKTLAGDIAKTESWETVRRLFHTIKGTAATFHRHELSAPAKAAEARCITALEETASRDYKTFAICVDRASQLATLLKVSFDSTTILECIAKETGSAKIEDTERDTVPDKDFVQFFVTDARAQIETVESALLRWERGENPADQIAAVQRGFHTLKGAANSIGLRRAGKSLHVAESFLTSIASGQIAASPEVFARLLSCVDYLREYLRNLGANNAAVWQFDWQSSLSGLTASPAVAATEVVAPVSQPESSAAPAAETGDEAAARTINIEAAQLYKLMNLIGELVSDRSRLERKIERLGGLQLALAERNNTLASSVTAFQKEFEFNLLGKRDQKAPDNRQIPPARDLAPGATGSSEFSELEFDRYDQFSILSRSLIEVAHDIDALSTDMRANLNSFAVDNVNFAQSSRKLQESVVNLTMIPMETVFPRLERAVRDANRAEKKDVKFELQGGRTLLDKTIMDRIHAPLLHLLRNAVSHGIESAEERARRNKTPHGNIRLTTTQSSNQVVIEISDDGGGINVHAIRARAIAKGWIASDAPPLTPEQAVNYIFLPGFSTATSITEISGRGIGLDVVRNEVESLSGSVEVKFEPQVGTSWTLRLPTNLAISEAVLAQCGGLVLAFPLNFIESGLIINYTNVLQANGRETYLHGGTQIPFVRLPSLLRLSPNKELKNGLIVNVGERRVLLATDRVFSRKEIVVKQLDTLMSQHPLLSGATLDPEGRVIPILNLPGVVKYSFQHSAVATPSATSTASETGNAVVTAFNESPSDQPQVLVVDDSLSVRKAQERFLTDIGCRVTTANDGLQALECLRNQSFDVIFTDLEMPQLNGYELIVEIRNHPAWTQAPIVVISSRGADKYITKAMNLGANSFLPKPFTEQQLLEVMRHYASWDGSTKSRVLAAVAA